MATPATASRTTAELDRFYGTLTEIWDSESEEVISRENPLLWLLMKLRMVGTTGGRDFAKNIVSYLNQTAEAFGGLQKLKIEAPKGPSTALWSHKNYKVSVQQLWEEGIEHSGEAAMMDVFQMDLESAEEALAQLLDTAFKEGQGNGALHWQGLEEAVMANDGHTASPELLTRSYTGANAAFTADNTYGGIARNGTDTMNLQWRNYSASLARLTGAPNETFLDGVTGLCHKAWMRALDILNEGGKNRIDLALMTMAPYADFRVMNMNHVHFQKNAAGESGTANIPFEHYKYNDVAIMKWERGTASAINYAAGGLLELTAGSEAASGAEMIYLLSTGNWVWNYETQAYFAWTDWIRPSDQLVRAAHLILRGHPRCERPKSQGVLFGYGS